MFFHSLTNYRSSLLSFTSLQKNSHTCIYTKGQLLAERFGILHVSTGELFRAESNSGSQVGRKMNEFIQKGDIIPSQFTFDYLRAEFSKPKYARGFMLDGYPKDPECFQFIMSLLPELGFKPTAALFFDVPRTAVEQRLFNRLICLKCETNYHRTHPDLKPKGENDCIFITLSNCILFPFPFFSYLTIKLYNK